MRLTLETIWAMAMAAVAGFGMTLIGVRLAPVLLTLDLGSHLAWYMARAAGMVAYLLAGASVAFGIATSTRLGGKLFGKGNVADVHRALSLLSIVAIGAHTLFLALDQYADFGLSELFVPFVTWYRPFWTGLGIIAAYLAVAVYASFYLRPVIGYKAWRAFHYAAFAVFGLGGLHGIMAGADSGQAWALALYGVTTAVVVAMLGYRLAVRGGTPGPVSKPPDPAVERRRRSEPLAVSRRTV